ncbi:MAG: hypothetical protein NPINA01_32660 [Nitrospinaceae bacterium]|nr:MAG: hypothetical protein NPINA01_32660 [Nitrospinaceae bacterium]
MDLFIANSFSGLVIFFIGITLLNVCSFIDRENHHNMKRSRMLVWYGRRKIDTFATLPFSFKSSCMTYLGSVLALYGLVQVLGSIVWMDF